MSCNAGTINKINDCEDYQEIVAKQEALLKLYYSLNPFTRPHMNHVIYGYCNDLGIERSKHLDKHSDALNRGAK